MTELSIIVLSFNTSETTIFCIQSVLDHYSKELIDGFFELIVVDNASSDDSVEKIDALIKKEKKHIFLIKNKKNLGFGAGNNIGVEHAKGKNVLFLNSDTKVLDKAFLSMVDFLDRNPSAAILGGKLENNDGSIQPSAGKFYNLFNLAVMLLGLERFGFLRSSPNVIKKVDWVSGACMMVRRDVFEKISGFDEKLFMYIEDMEICFRAKKLKYDTFFYPNIRLRHKSLGSGNRTFAIINIYRGILHFYSKHKTYPEYMVAKTLLVLKAEVLILVGFLTFNPDLRERYRKAIM